MRKLSVFLVLVAVSALTLASVSAQTVRCITPKQSAVNLRGNHAQSAQRVGTLAFGSQLQIIRKFNRWYAVQHNGGSAWVADWVVNEVACVGAAQPQPESQPAQSQPTANVDNYCFVNRHCTTDAEWVAGYHDYQRDLASGAAQSQPESQPAQSQPTVNVDNYCFVNRQCTTDAEWAAGYRDYQRDRASGVVQPASQQQPQVVSGESYYFNSDQYGMQPSLGPLILSPGIWRFEVRTGGYIIVSGTTFSNHSCMRGLFGDHDLEFLFNESRGQANPAQRDLRINRECEVSFAISNTREHWVFTAAKIR